MNKFLFSEIILVIANVIVISALLKNLYLMFHHGKFIIKSEENKNNKIFWLYVLYFGLLFLYFGIRTYMQYKGYAFNRERDKNGILQ